MSNRKQTFPSSRAQDERSITRKQNDFSGGMYRDLRVTPNNSLFYLANMVNKGNELEGRGGTKRWSNVVWPSLTYKGSYALTKSGTTVTKTSGVDFSQSDLGSYIVYDDGVNERIVAIIDDDNVTVHNDTPHSASTAAVIRGQVNGVYFHKAQRKILLHIDYRIFVASDINMTSWTQCYCISYNYPNNSFSVFDEDNNYAYMWNSSGIFKIDLSNTPITFYKINSPTPSIKITDSGSNLVTTPYGRRYIYSMLRLSGSGVRDRTTSGVVIEQESGPVAFNDNFRDFGEVWTSRPVGNGATNYGVLTGGALGASYDTPAEWAVISDGQFNITIDGIARNIKCTFSGITSMADVALRLQNGLRVYSKYLKCEYSVDHFIITNDKSGGTISVTSAGAGGTDIGTSILSCQSGTGTVTTPTYTAGSVVGTLTCPIESSLADVQQFHWTHYSVYATLDVGSNGIDPITGAGNISEAYAWVADIPIVNVLQASRTGYTVTATKGNFSRYDVGSSLVFYDGANYTSVTIASYTSSTVVETTTTGTISSLPCIIGDEKASPSITIGIATQAADVVVSTEGILAASDIGKTIFWSNGTRSYIIEWLGTSSVRVADSTTRTALAFAIDPVSRKFNDEVQDDNFSNSSTVDYLRSRLAGYPLQNRYWEPLPECDVGVIAGGFLFGAATGNPSVYYSQIAQGYEYQAGYYYSPYQTINMKDEVQALEEFTDKVAVFCSISTRSIPVNTFDTREIPEVGESISVISGQNVIDHTIGVYDASAICKKGNGEALVITSEPAIRMFDGSKYSDNLAQERIMNDLLTWNTSYAICYDEENGFTIWGLDTVES